MRASEEKKTTAICLQKSIDVNVIPNLSIVPKKLVMVTLKLSELHSENRPILPSKQRFLSCMAFSVGSRSRRIWRQRERLKNNRPKGDVTRDYSQRRFLAQHSVAILEQCCNYSIQCRNNFAMLCALKIVVANRLVQYHLDKQNNNFCTCITLFCTFLCRFCATTTWKYLISCFMENVNRQWRNYISLSELEYGHLEFKFRRVRVHLTK